MDTPISFRNQPTQQLKTKWLPCYLITKEGCEFIAHKLTGVKGTEFTAKYIKRFHQMENIIKEHVPQGKELLALAVLEAQKTIEEQTAQIEEMKPHAVAWTSYHNGKYVDSCRGLGENFTPEWC